MLYFVVMYVALAAAGFTCFIISNNKKKEERRCHLASEKIIGEDLLAYSLKNPYTKSTQIKLPQARRIMLGVKISNGKDKKSMVFDPEKTVYIGRSEYNHIVIYSSYVSQKHCCIFVKDNKLWISDLSMKKGVIIKRQGKKRRLAYGRTTSLHNKDIIIIDNVRIRIKLFIFDINHK